MMIELRFNCFFAIKSVSNINTKPPIRKLLVLTNQSSSGSLIYFPCNVLRQSILRCYVKVLRNMQESKFADIYFYEFSSFVFKVPVEKVVIDEKELHGIDVGELARNITKKKKPDILQVTM